MGRRHNSMYNLERVGERWRERDVRHVVSALERVYLCE